jgi:hypothetical protein
VRGVQKLNAKTRGTDAVISPTPNPSPRPTSRVARYNPGAFEFFFFNWSILQDSTDPPREETIIYAARDWERKRETVFRVIFFITQYNISYIVVIIIELVERERWPNYIEVMRKILLYTNTITHYGSVCEGGLHFLFVHYIVFDLQSTDS